MQHQWYSGSNSTGMVIKVRVSSPWELSIHLRTYLPESTSMTKIFFSPDSYTGDFTNMVVPSTDASDRPSWSIPIEGITADVGGGVVSVSGSMASIDPYCRAFPRCSIHSPTYLTFGQTQQFNFLLMQLRSYILQSRMPLSHPTMRTATLFRVVQIFGLRWCLTGEISQWTRAMLSRTKTGRVMA